MIIMAAMLLSSIAFAGNIEKLYVENIRYGAISNGVRVVFDLNKKSEYRAFVLDSPYRVVVDMPHLEWNYPKTNLLATNKIITAYRSGNLDNGLTRVVFDIKSPAIIKKTFILPKDGVSRDRLVIDIEKSSKNSFEARKEDVFGSKLLKQETPVAVDKSKMQSSFSIANKKVIEAAKPPASVVPEVNNKKSVVMMPVLPKKKPQEKRKYVVVLDAGHGGADPGAVINGVMEKNITLAVAKELRRQMEETGRYKVVLTRDKDFYVKLDERKGIARKVKADLFISLHADSIGKDNVRGASIYTLSEKASDSETARLAESENNSGFVAGVDLGHESQEVAGILLDLAMREKMNESNMYARFLNSSMIDNSIKLLPNSNRSAGFAVLKAPDVPSVLIEVGFISNSQEAKFLSSSVFHRNMSSSILNGTDAYFRKIESLQKL